MAGKGRRGVAPQTTKREQSAGLIARGVSSAEACRIVGVNRNTGKRWRHGRTITSSNGRRLHSAPVVGFIIEAMQALPQYLRRSLTWDQGSEMATHADVAQALEMPVYFCQKASPWQRPSNENTNGLLRQYFPKGTNLRAHGADEITAVAQKLNDRPRKTLDWQTPAALLADAIRPQRARASTRRRASEDRVPRSAAQTRA